MLDINDSIQYLTGVGEKRAQLYHKLGVDTIYSLLRFFPRTYMDFSDTISIAACPLNTVCCVKGKVYKKQGEQKLRQGLSLFKVFVTDDDSDLVITLFNTKYLFDSLELEKEYVFYGKVTGNLLRKEMNSPNISDPQKENAIKAIYPLTQGLSNALISKSVGNALRIWGDRIHDVLPSQIKKEHKLCHLRFAYDNIHFPENMNGLEVAKKRLVFEELLLLQLGLSMLKNKNRATTCVKISDFDLVKFREVLPFTLTNSQQKAIDDALEDFKATTPMNRLLQGDVGSGKTMVACALGYCMAKNSYQTAVMAPTEILATQHYDTFSNTLQALGIRMALLTGSTPKKEKEQVKKSIENGEIDIVIGTHALIQDSVIFKELGLVITDEQHRFGVTQRSRLTQKGDNPHKLVMSATPIPRTLALIIYGDLDISVINELPKGRINTKTYLINSEKRVRALQFVKKNIEEGSQAYIVCPLVEEGENEKLSVSTYAQALKNSPLKQARVGILHGKLKPKDKEEIMGQFKSGQLEVLVATTVIEVGVDVPNACVILIENAENFGLSQLHQLRGRVGRGTKESHCILLSDNQSEHTLKRLKIMEKSTDGFYIAEEDLKQRGPGDFFGEKQHGLPQLRIANMAEDMQVLKETSQIAKEILAEDEFLKLPKNEGLRGLVEELFANAKSSD